MPGLPGTALAFLTLALGSVAAWDRALLRGSRSPRAIDLSASGAGIVGVIVLASGETIGVRALGGIGVTRHWVALRSGTGTFSRRGVLVTAGMLGPAAFRNLRLWALWGRTPGMAVAQPPA